MRTVNRAILAFASALLLAPLVTQAADTEVMFDRHDPSRTIFPSNHFTVLDFTQLTFRRVNLPKPDCTVQPVACTDIDVLNLLDGFNPQPRISIPFTGPIDVSTVNSDTVYLINLGGIRGFRSFGEKVGINQIVWDTETNTLHVETDKLLEQQTRYAIIVTNGVRDAAGDPVENSLFDSFRTQLDTEYQDWLQEAERRAGIVDGKRIVGISLFTTLSTTGFMEKARKLVQVSAAVPTTFDVGNGGAVRAIFPLSSVTGITAVRQTGTAPTFSAPAPISVAALNIVPGSISHIGFGKFTSPSFLAPGEYIPTVGLRANRPPIQGRNDIYFNLFVPAGPKPDNGYPIAIFGHGFGSNKDAAPFVLAAKMAEQGVATIAINVVGHGQGPLGTLTVNTAGGPVVIPIGGRGIDQNGDGVIASTEGSSAAAPRTLIGSTDALRQTAIDLMQLVRQVQEGIDFDGDGVRDFDKRRIYYFGQSFGGIYGTMFLAIEPAVRVGVPNVAGGPTIEIIRLSPVFRPTTLAPAVQLRGLANLPPVTIPGLGTVAQFNENFPLRNQPPVINTVPGAMALQTFFDRSEWAGSIGNPVTYAPHLRKDPLSEVPAKSIIFQFAHGDQTVPNPTSSAIVRAGELTDRTSFYRNDLAFAANAATPKNPHTFLTNVAATGLGPLIALQAQTQIATFFASNGTVTLDPDGASPFFEVPIAGPLPETPNYIP